MTGFGKFPQSWASTRLATSSIPYSGASKRPASSAITISAKRPSRRKITGEPSSLAAFTTCPSSTTVLLPGNVLAGTGVEASASVQARSRFGQFDRNLDRVAILPAMGIADRYSAEQHLNGIVDVALLDAEKFEPVLVDRQPQPWPFLADEIVDVDDEWHFREDLLQLGSYCTARCGIGAIDFGEQRREHGRAGRHFDDLEAGSGGNGDGLELLPQIERDVMARPLAVAAGGEIDLQLAEFRSFAQIIVTY